MLLESHRRLNHEKEAQKLTEEYAEDLIHRAQIERERGNISTAALAWGAAAFVDLTDPSTLARSPGALDILVDAYLSTPGKARPVPFVRMPGQMQKLARQTYRIGKPGDAVRLWHAARQMGLRDVALYLNLGATQYEIGQPEEAEKTWNEGLQMHGNDISLKFNLATLLGERGATEKAELLFQEAISAAPDSVKLFVGYGALLESMGRKELALDVYKTGLRASSNNANLPTCPRNIVRHYSP